MLDLLIPKTASNNYHGGGLSFYAFCLLACVMLGRSLVHFFKQDSGVNSIASIISFDGSPDPDTVIHLFSSLWGSQQLLMVIIYGLVIWRYRNLIPMMFLLMVVEILFRMTAGFIHPLTPDFYLSTPPGKIGNIPIMLFSAIMCAWSIFNINRAKVQLAETRPGLI